MSKEGERNSPWSFFLIPLPTPNSIRFTRHQRSPPGSVESFLSDSEECFEDRHKQPLTAGRSWYAPFGPTTDCFSVFPSSKKWFSVWRELGCPVFPVRLRNRGTFLRTRQGQGPRLQFKDLLLTVERNFVILFE